jgi:succinoglycan biosynthesis protein ExoA
VIVSVVLPIRNEEKYIRACLENILNQDYVADEILVIDGRSTDKTRSIVRDMIAENPQRQIRLLDNPGQITASALNVGIQAARGEIIVRMDGHTVPAKNYISSCITSLETSNADNVGGLISPKGDTAFADVVAVAQSNPLGAGDAKFHYSKNAQYVDTVYMGAFRKSIFYKAGLYDESLIRNEDYEMNIRIRKAGGTIYLDPSIKSVYTPRNSPKKLWDQYFQYGWWKVETLRRHPESLRWRQLIPVLFVVSLVVLALFSFLTPVLYLLLAELGLYAATVGLTTLGTVKKLGFKAALFPLAILIIHVSWGVGFMHSLISAGRFPYMAKKPAVPRVHYVGSVGRERSILKARFNERVGSA